MKKTFILLATVFSVSTIFSSCEKPEKEEQQKSDVVYTAEEQKTKLQDIALELMSKFNPEDQKQAVALSDYLTRLYEDYDWDFSEIEDHYKGDYGFLYSVNRDVHRAVCGDVASNFATDLMAKASKEKSAELYKFANIDAVWEANEAKHKWEYKGKGNGGLVLKFKGPKDVQCEAKLWGVDGTITYKGTYEAPTGKYYIELNGREVKLPDDIGKEYYDKWWTKYEYEGEKYWVYRDYNEDDSYYYYIWVYDKHYVTEEDYENGDYEYEGRRYWVEREYGDQPFEATLPQKINFYLKEGATEHINYAMNLDVKKSDHYNFDCTIKITNITTTQGVKISKNAAGYVFSLKLGKEDLIKAVVDLKNCGLVDKADNQGWDDWFKMYYDMFRDSSLETGAAVAQVDILNGKLTIKTKSMDGMQFYKEWETFEDKYDDIHDATHENSGECVYEQAPYNMEMATLFNKFLQADMYYGDSKSVQAQMKWEAAYEDEEDWDGEIHQVWDCEPMMYFPADSTSYNFGKYFTEKRFNTVINAAEELVKKYVRLSERWGDKADDIDF